MKTLIFTLLAVIAPHAHAAHIQVGYSYDAAGRLTAANYNGTSRTAYSYDKNGSLLSRISTVTPTTTPPPHLAGTYNGLITNFNPTAGNMGSITLKLLSTGAFSGKFTLQGVSISFAGVFTEDGTLPTFHIIIDRAAPLTDFLLGLTLDVLSGVPRITGTLDGAGFSSQIALDPVLYNTTTNLLPGGLVSKYTALFLPEAPAVANAPQSSGYATIVITNAGAVTLAGKLANNVAITHSSQIVGVASWPLFVPLHTNAGYIAGNVFFNSTPGVSDFEGSIAWLKPPTGVAGSFFHPQFTTRLDLIGSRYDAPLTGQRALNFLGTVPNAIFNATGGNLAAPISRNITLDIANKFITPVDAVALKLTLTPASGLFTGTFKDGTATRTVGGVLFQEGNFGAGFFPGTSLSGMAVIQSNP